MDGDLHNFGQRVQKVERASGHYFQKPRPIFWEWLFFGTTSPLREIFLKSTELTFSLQVVSTIFNLEIDFNEDGITGFSKEVVAGSNFLGVSEKELVNFGIVLAYCHAFGIQDLHRGNLIRKADHLQVIDAEVVFAKNFVPNETLLLPFKTTDFDACGLSHYFKKKDEFKSQHLAKLLEGYARALRLIAELRIAIIREIRERIISTSKIPIRLILRDTLFYRKWQASDLQGSFFREEIIQLERGDIPYFFKFLRDDHIYHYESPGRFAAVTLPKQLTAPMQLDGIAIDELLDETRIKKDLYATGILSMARSFSPIGYMGTLALSPAEIISAEANTLTLQSPWVSSNHIGIRTR